jgi:hypothetical protein
VGTEQFLGAFGKLYQKIKETARLACEDSLQLAGLGIAAETDKWEAPLNTSSTMFALTQPVCFAFF